MSPDMFDGFFEGLVAFGAAIALLTLAIGVAVGGVLAAVTAWLIL